MMTRKDYILIAQALHDEQPKSLGLNDLGYELWDDDAYCQWIDDIEAVKNALYSTNPQFDAERFITVCKEGK